MKIITVAHQKGGVGKTTLAVNLASCFGQGLKVAVLDTDIQGSLTGTKKGFKDITFVPYKGKIEPLTKLEFDILIIDTPPYLTNQLPELFTISDFVLVPSKVGFYDMLAVKATMELLKQAEQKQSKLKYAVVLNMIKPRTGLTDDIKEMLKEYQIPLLQTTIADRVSYIRSALTNGVFDGDDEKAKEEIENLAGEIISIIGL